VEREPLLLHSLTIFEPLLEACLDAVAPKRVGEIGSETGGTTKLLVDWARRHDATVWTVEPFPAHDLLELEDQAAPLTVVRGRSPEALAEAPECGVWLIDGDHNYWTVRQECQRAAADGSLAILHDVAWPCARRDQYYDPTAIPPEGLHPHTWDAGVVPGDPGTRPVGGMRGDGQFAYAEHEGGEENGVLTAVESVAADRGDLELLVIPVVFGVGLLFPKAAPWADAVRAAAAPYAGSELLATLERNRISLYTRVLELQDEVAALSARHSGLATEYERQAAADAAELAWLRLERARALEANGGAPAAR